MKACFYLVFYDESVQKIMFKDNFLFHPNKHYKMYGKKFKATVSKAHKVIVNISNVNDRCGGFFASHEKIIGQVKLKYFKVPIVDVTI
jgi:hypothetical protein